MIYSTYFAKLSKLPSSIIPVAICRVPPKWYGGKLYQKIAPSEQMLWEFKRSMNLSRYEERYALEVLYGLNAHEVANDLMRIAGSEDVAMVCFEKQPPCHRFWVNEWLNMFDIPAEEFKF